MLKVFPHLKSGLHDSNTGKGNSSQHHAQAWRDHLDQKLCSRDLRCNEVGIFPLDWHSETWYYVAGLILHTKT